MAEVQTEADELEELKLSYGVTEDLNVKEQNIGLIWFKLLALDFT